MLGITNELMLDLTKEMPMKQIDINGRPYLQRYYAGTTADNRDLWLHRFMSSDGERHLHCHPFNARSVILSGSYIEEYAYEGSEGSAIREVDYLDVDKLIFMLTHPSTMIISALRMGRPITVFDWHRIAEVRPDTWTLFIVDPERLPMWFFRDDEGKLEPVVASPRDWHLGFGPRAAA